MGQIAFKNTTQKCRQNEAILEHFCNSEAIFTKQICEKKFDAKECDSKCQKVVIFGAKNQDSAVEESVGNLRRQIFGFDKKNVASIFRRAGEDLLLELAEDLVVKGLVQNCDDGKAAGESTAQVPQFEVGG